MNAYRAPRVRLDAERGSSLVEVTISVAVLATGLLASAMVLEVGVKELSRAKELEVARLAVTNIREVMSVVKFRGATTVDDTEWLFRGTYEVARTAQGTSFLMPDVRSTSTVTEDGIAGCVATEFPIGALAPAPGRTYAGRVVFFVNESTQPATIPTAAFPFAPSAGLTRLDCDGDGLLTTTNLRTGHSQSVKPCRLVPVKIAVDWSSESGQTERYVEYVLLGYPGHD